MAVPIQEIDFHNRTYELDCTGEYGPIPVRDGRWTSPEGPGFGSLNGLDVAFVDVTGDGELIGVTPYYLPEDDRCCPSMLDLTTWVLRHGGSDSDQTVRIPYPD